MNMRPSLSSLMPAGVPASCSKRGARRAASARGFTLLEVLVALTIIAVALTAALRGAMALTGNAQDIDRKLYAVITAENQQLELRFGRSQVGIGESRFDCGQGGMNFVCTQSITPTPNPFFKRVEVHVASTDEKARDFADLMALLPMN